MTGLILGLLATVSSIQTLSQKECDGILGEYNSVYHTINLCPKAEIHTIIHELGHHLWYYHMTKTEREDFTALHNTGYFTITRYAMTNEREDFAEMFMTLILKKNKLLDIQLLQPKTIYVQSIMSKYSGILSGKD